MGKICFIVENNVSDHVLPYFLILDHRHHLPLLQMQFLRHEAAVSSLIIGSQHEVQIEQVDPLDKSAFKMTLLIFPGDKGRKIKALQKKKIRPTKRYHSSSNLSDWHLNINLEVNDRDKPDSSGTTFCNGNFSEDAREKVWIKCLSAKCGNTHRLCCCRKN